MKKEWIYNFHKILTNHKDISDYERYYISYVKYIEENKEEHPKILKVLLKTLSIFKKTFLLSITYRLLSKIKIPIKINEKMLSKHFKKKALRKYLFPIYKLTNKKIKEKKILKMLYDESYEDKFFFEYLGDKKNLLTDFLLIKDTKYIRKQLLTILHTKYYVNMKYFICFLGDKNKHIGFLVYEILTQMVKENVKIEDFEILTKSHKENVKTEDFEILNELHNESTTTDYNEISSSYINLKEKIKVESIDNFLMYFLCFMENKIEIYEMIKQNKIAKIEKILKKLYVCTNDKLKEIKNINLYSVNLIDNGNAFNNFVFEDINEDYTFLFAGVNYKSISDCVEF